MTNPGLEFDDMRDCEGKNYYENLVVNKKMYSKEEFMEIVNAIGRDNSRTPLHWTDEDNAGFSTVKPWMKINPNYKEVNVKKQ